MIFQYMFYSLEGGLPSSMKPNVSSALLGDIGCSKIIGNYSVSKSSSEKKYSGFLSYKWMDPEAL